MSYVRVKKIRGREYYYLCKSIREGCRIRQVVLEYLGVEKPDQQEEYKLKEKHGEALVEVRS